MVQLLLEIKSMPTHISSYRFTRLNVVDILSPDTEGDYTESSALTSKTGMSEGGVGQVAFDFILCSYICALFNASALSLHVIAIFCGQTRLRLVILIRRVKFSHSTPSLPTLKRPQIMSFHYNC